MDIDVCRICCENKGTINVYEENNGVKISSKIMHCCANVYISDEDGLPPCICRKCEEELSFAYQFVLKCELADKKLRSFNFVALNDECEPKQEVKNEEKNKEDHEDNLFYDLDPQSPLESHQNKDIKSESLVNLLKVSIAKRTPNCNDEKPSCKDCGKKCRNNSSLAIHMRKHSEHRAFACTSCDKKYKDSGNLKRHIERNHNQLERKRKFICEHCGKAFYSKSDVKIHMRTHTGETPFVCNLCPQKFSQIGALVRHQIRHSGDRSHACSKCNKKFHTKEDLRRHQISHTSEKKHMCTTCNVQFKYKSNLQKHMKMHSTSTNFVCNHCGRTFNAKGNLKNHIDNMHSNKSGFCETCSKNVPDVEVHMWRHTGKRPLKCDHCSSSFFEKKSLTRHLNFRHKQSDKYKCTVEGCSVSFPSQPMLEYHTAKFHGSVIPFPCDRCSRGFYRKTDLAKHKIRNHGDN